MTTAPTAADFKVELVDADGAPNMKVAVVGDQVVDIDGATPGQVLTIQNDGTVAPEDPFDLDAMRFKGVIDASANPNYPAASAGDLYRISVAGKIGGGAGVNVEVGDLAFAIADNAGGTQAAVGASWSIEQANIDGAVVGPAAAVDSQLASFNGTSGKLIKDSGLALDVDGTLAANSDTKVASQKAVKTYADTKVAKSLFDANTVLAADTDDTPAALTVAASRIVGRAATGNIAALTPAQMASTIGHRALITRTVLVGTAATIDFSAIPATFENLMLEFMGRGDQAAAFVSAFMTLNGDTGANYDTQDVYGNVAVPGAAQSIAGNNFKNLFVAAASATAGSCSIFRVWIPSYARTTFRKMVLANITGIIAADGNGMLDSVQMSGLWRSTAAVNQITLTPSAGNFAAGTVCSLYGEG